MVSRLNTEALTDRITTPKHSPNMSKREKIRLKFNGLCAYSGKPLGDDWQVDHVQSKINHQYKTFRSGLTISEQLAERNKVNHIDNLFPACRIVNHYKRSLDLEGFRQYMKSFHLRLAKLPKNTNVPRTKSRKEYMMKVAEIFSITPEKPFNGTFYFETLEPKQTFTEPKND